jgi:hypothetical protein
MLGLVRIGAIKTDAGDELAIDRRNDGALDVPRTDDRALIQHRSTFQQPSLPSSGETQMNSCPLPSKGVDQKAVTTKNIILRNDPIDNLFYRHSTAGVTDRFGRIVAKFVFSFRIPISGRTRPVRRSLSIPRRSAYDRPLTPTV